MSSFRGVLVGGKMPRVLVNDMFELLPAVMCQLWGYVEANELCFLKQQTPKHCMLRCVLYLCLPPQL